MKSRDSWSCYLSTCRMLVTVREPTGMTCLSWLTAVEEQLLWHSLGCNGTRIEPSPVGTSHRWHLLVCLCQWSPWSWLGLPWLRSCWKSVRRTWSHSSRRCISPFSGARHVAGAVPARHGGSHYVSSEIFYRRYSCIQRGPWVFNWLRSERSQMLR